MLDAWIYDGLRTPFGRHAGALAPVRADDLVAGVMRALLARSPWKPEALEDVLVGCTNQAGEDSRNVARHAALLAGLPPSTPAQTVNRLCASGLAAVVDAARAITAGEGELYLVGGVESMSRAPFAMAKADSPYSREARVFDTTLGARFPNPRLAEAYGSDTMPETGDNVAREQGITRAEADRYALRSQERAERAGATGFLSGEIAPVEVPGPGKGTTVVRVDEHPRPATTAEGLARLRPLFAGGVESMSRAPFAMAKAEGAYARDVRVFDTTLGARFPNPRLAAAYGSDTMPETGDNVAREQGISRAEADRFAARSQERAERARATGFLEGEIVPVEVPGPGKGTTLVRVDEHPRPATTVEALARLSPLFAGGVVTAGNASGVNDGAAALLVGSRAAGERAGVRPLARILSSAAVGVEPRVMGIGPALAIPKVLARAGLGLDRMDVIEVNEAFASQVLACLRILGLPFDDGRVNPNGGAIALGHPLGASGARLALTAARELRRRGGGRAVVSLCIGVGQGLAMVMEAA